MKNSLCLFLILTAASFVFGQKTFDVQNFSDDYYGKVYIEKPSEVFSPGWIAIYQKKSGKMLLKVKSDELAIDTENEKVKTNVKELPYGEQSVIIYEDFNFDGIKDFAIEDGQNSCYHGPSFQIFLGGRIKGKFLPSPAFTKLAQEYCGMFEVDGKAKRLSTMTKSGCCWHQFSEYIVVNNKPKAIRIVEDDAMNYPISNTTTETWSGSKKTIKRNRTIDLEGEDVKTLFSFKTQNGGKEIVLFENDKSLSYVIINQAGNIEFAYPQDSKQEEPVFMIDSRQNPTNITFTNNQVIYKIYDEAGKVGIQINVKGTVSDLSGSSAAKKGSLNKIIEANLNNVTFK